ncbi:L,D-transpeptidase family protein [Chromohalobacter sp.]|uniref:L,D-transpeptidase family protein n=1 Tax=Chromohalobacter sp. TaxID=50740 RepID=UPI0025877C9F|nr:L,D-transpeptidase family protein [Chromohalobacter sp.]MCI0592321.1 L,D-transpeptidase family protein [Chromohalobacter sp.]
MVGLIRFVLSLLVASVLGLGAASPSMAGVPSGTLSVPLGGGESYIFEKGDKLDEIAKRFGVTVKAIVKANGLPSSRRVIPGMVLTIPTTPDAISPAIAPKIDPKPADGKVIYISLSKQHMWAYDGDRLVFDFLVSTGLATEENPNRVTKPGVFRVKNKLPEAYAGLWGLRMPYWMGIYDAGDIENGIHAMPILNSGRSVRWRVGSPGSYGCVVLNTQDAIQLYRWSTLGTLVVIRR